MWLWKKKLLHHLHHPFLQGVKLRDVLFLKCSIVKPSIGASIRFFRCFSCPVPSVVASSKEKTQQNKSIQTICIVESSMNPVESPLWVRTHVVIFAEIKEHAPFTCMFWHHVWHLAILIFWLRRQKKLTSSFFRRVDHGTKKKQRRPTLNSKLTAKALETLRLESEISLLGILPIFRRKNVSFRESVLQKTSFFLSKSGHGRHYGFKTPQIFVGLLLGFQKTDVFKKMLCRPRFTNMR